MALKAGIDLVLFFITTHKQRGSLEALKAAVLGRELSTQVIRQAADRVLHLKARHLSWHDLTTSTTLPVSIGREAHLQLQNQAYELSTTLVRNRKTGFYRCAMDSGERIVLFSPQRNSTTMVEDRYYSDDVLADIIEHIMFPWKFCLLATGTLEDAVVTITNTGESDTIIVATVNAHLDERQAELGALSHIVRSGALLG